jgi:hypothetical protein
LSPPPSNALLIASLDSRYRNLDELVVEQSLGSSRSRTARLA